MASYLDFLFGRGPLKKAAKGNLPEDPPVNNQDAGIDLKKLAEEAAERERKRKEAEAQSTKSKMIQKYPVK